MNIKFKARQTGFSPVSILLAMVVVITCFLLVLKIVPVYMDNYKLRDTFKAVEKTPNLLSLNSNEIRNIVGKSFQTNYVTHIAEKDVLIVKQSDYVKVNLDYERVTPLVGNMSLLMQFHEGFETTR